MWRLEVGGWRLEVGGGRWEVGGEMELLLLCSIQQRPSPVCLCSGGRLDSIRRYVIGTCVHARYRLSGSLSPLTSGP